MQKAIAGVFGVALLALAATAGSAAAAPVSDDFNTCALDTGVWTVKNPIGDGTVALVGAGTGNATLELSVPAGSNHDIWETGNRTVRVVQRADDTDFELEVKFDSVVIERYEMQGIVIQESSDRYLRFDFQGLGSSVRIVAAKLVEHVGTFFSSQSVTLSSPNYMRVQRVGDQWTQSYSVNGTTWVTVANFAFSMKVKEVGVYAGNTGGGGNPQHTAVVDYFENKALPISQEDVNTNTAGPFTLTATAVGNGQLQVVPDQASYTCADTVTLTAIPDPGYRLVGWTGDVCGTGYPLEVSMVRDKAVTGTFALDTAGPVISGVEVIPGATSVEIRWTTDEPATSKVSYGLTTSYELGFAEKTALKTEHVMILSALQEATQHHIQLSSTDANSFVTTGSDLVFTTTTNPSGLVSDDFNAPVLNAGTWTTYDPKGDSTFALVGTGTSDAQLQISVPAGVEHDIWKTGYDGPRAMQACNDTDFEVEAKFESVLNSRYQLEGIVVEEDADRLIVFGFYSDDNDTYIYSSPLVDLDPTITPYNYKLITDSAPRFMRVRRVGDQWTLFYSFDGEDWLPHSSFSFALGVAKVGVWGGNAPTGSAPAHTAIIDYFVNTASQLPCEDVPPAAVGPYTLTLQTVGAGSVQRDPDQPNYSCNNLVTVTPSADPGFAFDGWSGDITSSQDPLVVSMVRDLQLTAIFVDNEAPVITLLGADPLKLKVGDPFSDPGVTATDNVDGDLTTAVVVGGDTVDPNTAASYTISYNVSDGAGNAAAEVTREVIVDGQAPVITLLGADPTKLKVGDPFNDPGVTAADDVDGDLTSAVVLGGDTVDPNTAASYTISYNVSDQAGNAAVEVTREVIVDGQPPVITLLGDNPLNLYIGDPAILPGATAVDDVDGDVSTQIVVGGDAVDTDTLGIYAITYNVSDAAGNAAAESTREVHVVELPVPKLTIEPQGADILLRFQSVQGLYYEVHTSPNLSSWILVGGQSGDGTEISVTHEGGGGATRNFYLVKVMKPAS